MPELEDFHDYAFFMNPIVNPDWSVEEFANAAAAGNGLTNPGKRGKEVYVIEKSVSEALRRSRIVSLYEL